MTEFEIRPSFAWRFGQSALYLSGLVVIVVLMVSAGPGFALFWILGIALVAAAWCWLRLWRVKIVLESDKVTVVDMFKTVHIPRSNVESISPLATVGKVRHEYFIDFRDGGNRRVSWLFSYFKPNYEKQVKLNQINAWASEAKDQRSDMKRFDLYGSLVLTVEEVTHALEDRLSLRSAEHESSYWGIYFRLTTNGEEISVKPNMRDDEGYLSEPEHERWKTLVYVESSNRWDELTVAFESVGLDLLRSKEM